ncbi:helix-turn-helix domain-containing protein [Pengzhenrongella sp.]|jgi:excisionase family DNA binding protein|uniref:helix-turn-helix domain-containing protein n=1 Tax=Pengzhenrongella sp. TaxID=2888820 RepID=UPI002F94DF23
MTSTITDPSRSEFITVAEAAEELHVTERFIRKLIATGDLSAVKVGSRLVRIRRASLEEILRPVRTIAPTPRRR